MPLNATDLDHYIETLITSIDTKVVGSLSIENQKELGRLVTLLKRSKRALVNINCSPDILSKKGARSELGSALQLLAMAINTVVLNPPNLVFVQKLRYSAEYTIDSLVFPNYSKINNPWRRFWRQTKIPSKILLGFLVGIGLNIGMANLATQRLQDEEVVTFFIGILSLETPQNPELEGKQSIVRKLSYEQLTGFITWVWICGTLGSMISIFSRVLDDRDSKTTYSDDLTPIYIGAFKPVIGGVTGILFYFILFSQLLPIQLVLIEGSLSIYLLAMGAIAFVGGFSERLFKDIISKTENIFGQESLSSTTEPTVTLPTIPEASQENTLEATPISSNITNTQSPLDNNVPLTVMSTTPSINPVEIRGVWLANRPHSAVLESADNIKEALDFLQEMGFNTVFPVVWNQGFTLFPSEVMVAQGFPQQAQFFAKRNFDPLDEIVRQAQARKIAVIPWFEYGFAASPIADGGHILQTKPSWAALDKDGQKVRHGGLTWMNSLDAEVQRFMLDLILEVAQKYSVHGIQGDDRLPALPFHGGYNQTVQDLYKQKFGIFPPNNGKDTQWVNFRAAILTDLLRRLFTEVKAVNPNLVVSMAPGVYPFCLNNLMQDSLTWVQEGLCDFLHPQIYRQTFEGLGMYAAQVKFINETFTAAQRVKFAPGIAFKANGQNVSVEDILKIVNLNRRSGFSGEVFFFYEGLRKNVDEIAIALQDKGGYAQAATLPPPLVV
jgi:uncharacterized lipoprotein YddW (UPF0748 family)